MLIEEIRLRPAWRSQWPSFLIILLSGLVYLIIYHPWVKLFVPYFVAYLVLKILIRRYNRSYMIGPKGVEVQIGLFQVNMTRIEYRHIRGVNLRQSLFNRLMSIGQILVSTSGMESELIISDINTPACFADIIKNRLKEL
jgi:uncharacterized membrane protein YdbT with pleckstrin-like domain